MTEAQPEEYEEGRELALRPAGDRRRPSKIESLADLKARGLSADIIETFVRQTYNRQSFVNAARFRHDFPLAQEADDFICEVDRSGYDKAVETFLKAPDSLKEWLVGVLSSRTAKAMEEVAAKAEERLKDLHDVHVSIISANERTRAAIRRNDPRRWNIGDGKGRAPRALLSAWTAACSVAVETLMRARPATEAFSWTTGWVYSVPEEKNQGDRYRSVSIAAMCQSEGNTHRFLLNPVNDDGTLKYLPSDSRDRQRLQALAMHEVAHVLENYHNETYAGVLTDLMMEFDTVTANRRMKDAVRAVMAAYEHGRARVQAMDDEPGPRPAERLMAIASGNSRDHEAVERHADGTWTVDSDRLQDHVGSYESDDVRESRMTTSAR